MQLVHDVPHLLELMDEDDPDYLEADALLPRCRIEDPDQDEALNGIVLWDGEPTRVAELSPNEISDYLLPAYQARAKAFEAHSTILANMAALASAGPADRPVFDILIDRIADVIDAHLADPNSDRRICTASLADLDATAARLPGIGLRSLTCSSRGWFAARTPKCRGTSSA